MRAALQDMLYGKYPLIFGQRSRSPSESAMAMGIDCADGWYPLLDGLCEVLSNHARRGDHATIEAVQAKQKLGGLRFYFDGGCDRSKGAVRLASAMSYRICEESGCPGMLMARGGWIRTLAEDVGRMQGYHPRGPDAPEPGEQGYTTGGDSGFHGWHAIATTLRSLAAEAAPFSAVHLAYADVGLSVEIRNGTEWVEGAGECAAALSARTDAVTGAMRTPI
jgi:hypothetical protein